MERKKRPWLTKLWQYFSSFVAVWTVCLIVNLTYMQVEYSPTPPLLCIPGIEHGIYARCIGYKIATFRLGDQVIPFWGKEDERLKDERKTSTTYTIPDDFDYYNLTYEQQVEKYIKENVDPDFDISTYQKEGTGSLNYYYQIINGISTLYHLTIETNVKYDPKTNTWPSRVTEFTIESSNIHKKIIEELKKVQFLNEEQKNKIWEKIKAETKDQDITFVGDKYCYRNKILYYYVDYQSEDGMHSMPTTYITYKFAS